MNFLPISREPQCSEKMLILDETREVLKYTLSNSLDDIKIAIYARTRFDANLNYASWQVNKDLSVNVKHLMNNHNVNYSMTTDIRERTNTGDRFIEVNMRAGDEWFVTGYEEIDGKFYNCEEIKICRTVLKNLKKYYGISFDDDD